MHVVDVIEDLLVRLGTSWVLWLLFSLFLVCVAVAIERWVYFRSKDGDVHAIAAGLDANLLRGNIKGALRALKPMQSVGAIVARAGLRLAPRGARAAEKGMRGAISVERKALDARLVYLGTLRTAAPLVGLFGTVVAAILPFAELGRSGAALGARPMSLVVFATIAALGKGLVSTAVGVGVGLVAVAAHAYFQRRTAELLDDADTVSNLVLANLTTQRPSSQTTGLVRSSGSRAPDEKSGSRKRPNPEAA
jgi:biopolymer transport protein ExbB